MWNLARLWIRFKKEIFLAWAMVRNPAVPMSSKLLIAAAVAYVVFPFDLVPDVPIIGWLDDGLIAYLLLQFATKLLPPELLSALRTKVESRDTARPMRG